MDGDCYDLEPLAKASVGRIASGLSRHIAQDIQTWGIILLESFKPIKILIEKLKPIKISPKTVRRKITFATAPPSCPSPPRPTCWSCPGGYWGPPGSLGQKISSQGKGGGIQISQVQIDIGTFDIRIIYTYYNKRFHVQNGIGTLLESYWYSSPGTQAVVVRPAALSSALHFSPFQRDF